MNKMLTVSHEIDVDLTSGEKTDQTYVRVYNSIFTSGIVKEIGTSGLTTLIALASFMNEDGECFPTQQQIADRIGCHKNTANKYVNDLLAARVNDKPVVTRTKVNKGQGQIYSFYKIHPLSQLAKFGGEIEEVDAPLVTDVKDIQATDPKDTNSCDVIKSTKNNIKDNNSKELSVAKFTPKDAISLFAETYREIYGVNYTVPNYGQAVKLLNDKVLKPYPEFARDIIVTGVREYAGRWKTARYPRPTLFMYTYYAPQILEALQEQKSREESFAVADEKEAEAERAMIEKLGKLV